MTIRQLVCRLSILSVSFETIGNMDLYRECMELAYDLVGDDFDPRSDVTFIYDPRCDFNPSISTGNFIVYKVSNSNVSIDVYVSEYVKKLMDENQLSF